MFCSICTDRTSCGVQVEFHDIRVTPVYKSWTDKVQKLFGGLDIFAINVLVKQDDSEHIIGIHDTDCEFADQHINDVAQTIVRLVQERIAERVKALKNCDTFP